MSNRAVNLTTLLVACLSCALAAPPARAEFGVTEQHFEAGTCYTAGCTYASIEADHGEAFTQAAGHPPDGLTSFEFNSKEVFLAREPEGRVRRIRVDLPPGLAADPQALEQCPLATFEAGECATAYPGSQAGVDELTIYLVGNAPISAPVYDLKQPPGVPLDFGIEVPIVKDRLFLEGHVSWQTDYHEYFEINNVPESIPILKSKLVFDGTGGEGDFLTLPSECSATATSRLEVESYEGQISRTQTHTPLGVEGCNDVPFAPLAAVSAGAR